MATFDTDVSLYIYGQITNIEVGQDSQYTDTPHPGTIKQIEGWKWDQRLWPGDLEFDSAAYAPSVWDPSVSGVDLTSFQSGHGDNKDLALLGVFETDLDNARVWAPRLNHGHYYVRDQEWYLYSDAYLTEYITDDPAFESNGNLELQLSHRPKPTIPMSVAQYEFDFVSGGYVKYREFRRKPEFTTSGTDYEYLLDDSVDPPQVVVSGLHVFSVGGPVVALPGDTEDLEILGTSTGAALQSFNSKYSPIADYAGTTEVWVWIDPITAVQWTVIDTLQDFSAGASKEAKLDKDLGVISFGDYDAVDNPTGSGDIPDTGSRIGLYYKTGIAVEYEPEYSINYVLSTSLNADINPINSASQSGFLQVTTESVEPASIELTSDLPGGNPFLIDLGNNIGRMTATVRTKSGKLLEGQEVIFELVDPKVGSFGATTDSIQSTTRANGAATVLYNSPATVLQVGAATTNIIHDGADTVITVTNIVKPDLLTGLTTYKIHEYDEVLGIPVASGLDYYTNYFTEENITEDPDGTAATQTFEEQYRTVNILGQPTTYTGTELVVGKKTILFDATKSTVMNPHTGKLKVGTLSPLYPDSITNIGTAEVPVLELRFTGILLPLILSEVNDRTKGYFVVGDGLTTVQASVINRRTGQRIISDPIQVRVQVPNTVNGNFFANILNDVPNGLLTKVKNVDDLTDGQISATQGITSLDLDRLYIEEKLSSSETYIDWFRRTRRGDTILMTSAAQLIPDPAVSGLDTVEPDSGAFPSEIPLGFRLRSTGITIASVLDQVTFLEGNSEIPEDYFDITSSVGVLGNSFIVT